MRRSCQQNHNGHHSFFSITKWSFRQTPNSQRLLLLRALFWRLQVGVCGWLDTLWFRSFGFWVGWVSLFPRSFSEISTNFSENFLKNLVKISIKFYLRIAETFVIVNPKFSENFLFFCRISTNFHYIFITYQQCHNQLIKVFKNWPNLTFNCVFLYHGQKNIRVSVLFWNTEGSKFK